MSISVVILCFLVISLASGEDERDLDTLEKLFKRKYADSGYKEWTELHDANTTIVEHVCSKYIFVHTSATSKSVEGTKRFRERYTLANRTEPVFHIDTLTCNITQFGQEGDVKGRQRFYLTDGDEPNSAFKFALIKEGIFLTRKVTNVWT